MKLEKMKSNLLVLIVLLSGFCSFSFAAGKTVESLVADIAAQHNSIPKSDEMTASSTATPNGKQLIFRNVMRIKKGLLPQQLAAFRSGLVDEVVRPACAANMKTWTFAKDLTYQFIYDNTYGERLAVVDVSLPICQALK